MVYSKCGFQGYKFLLCPIFYCLAVVQLIPGVHFSLENKLIYILENLGNFTVAFVSVISMVHTSMAVVLFWVGLRIIRAVSSYFC